MIKLEELAPDVARRIAVVPEEDPAAAERERLEAERREAKRLAFSREAATGNIPPAYAAAYLEAGWLRELVGEDAIAKAIGSATAPRVAFIGPPGAGKTSMAAAMFRAA